MPESEEIMDNLADSESKLEDLNARLDTLKGDYNQMVANNDFYSFFNFDNIYFWFVLVGLILLAFGLIFLLVELQHTRSEKKEKKKAKTKEIEEKVEELEDEEIEDEEDEEPSFAEATEGEKPKKSAPKKIKVVKVK